MITLPINKNFIVGVVTLIIVGVGIFTIDFFRSSGDEITVSVSSQNEIVFSETNNFSIEYNKRLWRQIEGNDRFIKFVHGFEEAQLLASSRSISEVFSIENEIKAIEATGVEFNLLSSEETNFAGFIFHEIRYNIRAEEGKNRSNFLAYYYANEDRVFKFLLSNDFQNDSVEREVESIINTFDIK